MTGKHPLDRRQVLQLGAGAAAGLAITPQAIAHNGYREITVIASSSTKGNMNISRTRNAQSRNYFNHRDKVFNYYLHNDKLMKITVLFRCFYRLITKT